MCVFLHSSSLPFRNVFPIQLFSCTRTVCTYITSELCFICVTLVKSSLAFVIAQYALHILNICWWLQAVIAANAIEPCAVGFFLCYSWVQHVATTNDRTKNGSICSLNINDGRKYLINMHHWCCLTLSRATHSKYVCIRFLFACFCTTEKIHSFLYE